MSVIDKYVVFVETDAGGWPVRIFRTKKAAQNFSRQDLVKVMDKRQALSQIRKVLYEQQFGECIRCGEYININTAHMHEKKHRGKGGEVSVENSELLCSNCHIGKDGEHSDRRPRFGETISKD